MCLNLFFYVCEHFFYFYCTLDFLSTFKFGSVFRRAESYFVPVQVLVSQSSGYNISLLPHRELQSRFTNYFCFQEGCKLFCACTVLASQSSGYNISLLPHTELQSRFKITSVFRRTVCYFRACTSLGVTVQWPQYLFASSHRTTVSFKITSVFRRAVIFCFYRPWCHSPVATISLCFLTQNYSQTSKLRLFSGGLCVSFVPVQVLMS